jgi:hypothetical protein
MKQANPSPWDVLRDQTLQLAERLADRIAHSQAQPDEYAQLSPLVQQVFSALRNPPKGIRTRQS